MTPEPTASMSPVRGTRKFRRNARLAVSGGVFTATDRHGLSASVPVDGSASSPRYFATRNDPVKKHSEMAILDGEGRAFVVGNIGDWDAYEKADLQDALGLQSVMRNPEDVPSRRADAVVVLDSDWWRFAPVVGPIGFAAGMFASASDAFRWIGVPVLLGAFVYLMAALALGAFSRSRRGPDWEAREAWKRGDPTPHDAALEARRKRREAAPSKPDEEASSAESPNADG